MLSWIDESIKKMGKRLRERTGETYSEVTEAGVQTLHPTKGWRFISQRRIEAGVRMASMLDRQPRTAPKKKPKVYRDTALRRAAGLVLRRKFPQPVTRQQRRYAKRKGLALEA